MALTPVAVALEKVLAGKVALPAETVPLLEGRGRVLASDMTALRTQPPFDVSAMDGYAVRFADARPAGITAKVVGESAAGRPFAGRIAAGEAVRIFTGAGVPDGADCVLLQEDVAREGDAITSTNAVREHQHIRAKGLDFAEGVVALKAGTVLNGRALALIAAMNHAQVPVIRRPRVAIISTGDELKPAGSKLGPADIVSSNATMIAAQVIEAGGVAEDFGIVGDTLEATLEALRRAVKAGHEVIVTSGGASVGDYDFMQKAIQHEGATLGFWKLAMRPGKPLMLADLGGSRLLGLPGNPVSSFVCAELFLKPLLKQLGGFTDCLPRLESARLGTAMKANDQRADYVRARLDETPHGLVATPFGLQDSSMMRVLAQADCLIVREPFAPAAQSGESVPIIRL